MEKNKLGLVFVILAGAFWGTTGTITKYIYAFGVDPLTLSLLRIGISFFGLLAFAIVTGRKIRFKRQHALFFLGFGTVSVAAFNVFYLTAIQLTTVTTAVVLLYTAPAFTLIAARIVLKESFTTRKFLALLLTFAGIVLVVEAYRPGQLLLNVPGVLTGLASGLTYGLYSIFSKGALRRGYTTLETVILALGAGLLMLSFVRPPWHLIPLIGEPFILWLLVVAIAVFSTMLAYVFFVSGLVHIDAGKATLVAAVEPVVAIIAAMLFLGETITILQFVGIVAVLAAIRFQA
jgi:drug/metabolite transporter (DMT)-like permease